jgi:hypothetical protein
MKSLARFIALSLLTSACVQAQEISLFNGRDLTGWKGLSEYWSVKDGAITGRVTSRNVSKGNTFLVWQGGDVADFELSLKFKLDANNSEELANSGIQFRAFLEDAGRYGLKGYQAELDPGTHHPSVWPNMASLIGCLMEDPPGILLGGVGQKARSHGGEARRMVAPIVVLGSLGTEQSVAASYRKNDWNDCRIIAVGNHLQTFINGLPAADVIDDGNRYSRGLLGLQLHGLMKEKTLQFKDIKLRVLTAGSTATSPLVGTASMPASTIQTDPNQPRIEVIKDQGPNATEWALTPLDEAIPADIRQNITFLREDLLDEGKKAAKANPEAYKLASDYCDKLLAALDQRELARVNAGYAAAQADANKNFSNSALEARRNYQMSWPQFSREESQRAALRESETNKADVKKQRLKVEWATRATQMRAYLDNLYRQLREAMR